MRKAGRVPSGTAEDASLPKSENDFGVEGFLVMLVGNRAPYTAKHAPTAAELQLWERHRAEASATAQTGLTVAETLAYIRHPDWTWPADNAAPATPAHAQYGVR